MTFDYAIVVQHSILFLPLEHCHPRSFVSSRWIRSQNLIRQTLADNITLHGPKQAARTTSEQISSLNASRERICLQFHRPVVNRPKLRQFAGNGNGCHAQGSTKCLTRRLHAHAFGYNLWGTILHQLWRVCVRKTNATSATEPKLLLV